MYKVLIAIIAIAFAIVTHAGVIYYDASSGVRELTQESAWVGGRVPAEDDIAILSSMGGECTIGRPIEWRGLVFSNLTSTVTLRSANGATLTLGASGISTGGRTNPKGALALYVPVIISCDQDWYTMSSDNGAIAIYGGVTCKGGAKYKLTLRNYAGEASSLYGIRSALSVDLGAHGTKMNIDDNDGVQASVLGVVDIGWGHALGIYNAGNGEKKFGDIFLSHSIVNDGCIGWGGAAIQDRRADILFEDGDSIVGNESLKSVSVADDSVGSVYQWLGKFRMTGGLISNNTYVVRAGDYIQEGGRVWLRDGLSTAGAISGAGQRLCVSGTGTELSTGSLALGQSNSETMQNWMVVSNGAVVACGNVCLTDEDRTGIGANTRLSVIRGRMSATGVCFGNQQGSVVSANAAACLDVEGGELDIGRNGITVATNCWNRGLAEDASVASWYRVRVTDGKVRAISNHENTASIVLENTAEISVDADVIMQQTGTLSGPASLVKTGAGTLALPKTCAWTGETVVSNGTLVVGLSKPKIPYIRFRADDLTLAENAFVDAWRAVSTDKTHTNAFTKETATAVGIPARPTFKTDCFNGHAAIIFNGANQGLAMSGGTKGTSNDGPVNGSTNFTVAVVFRAISGSGASGAGNPAFGTAGILGQYYQKTNNRWMMGLASDGTPCSGLAGAVMATAADDQRISIWPSSCDVRDGKAHVAIFNWTAGCKLRLNIDGKWTEMDDVVNISSISGTRLLLGVSEAATGSGFKYFGGEIAEISIYRDDVLTTDEIDAIGFDLARTYGAVYTLSMPGDGTTMSATESLPVATGLWRADDLSQTAGQAVSVWKDSTANAGEFNTTVGLAIKPGTTAPTIASMPINGHKAVAFNGVNNMLGMTGGMGSTYIGSVGKNFTVAMVMRPKNAAGAIRGSWVTSAGVMGQAYSGSNDQNKWGIGLSSSSYVDSEQVVMGIRDGSAGTKAVHGRPRDMLDGRPHVVICSFGTDMTINVDGVRSTFVGATTVARQAGTRTTLGRLEDVQGNNGGFFKGDIAEIRFYADTTLSFAQQNALGRELALKYGIDAGGFFSDCEPAFLSQNVAIAKGAVVFGAGAGIQVRSGMTVGGAGKVLGRIVLEENAVLRATLDAQGKIDPLSFGSVVWPVGGVTVELPSECPEASGVLCTWTSGEPPDVSKWTIRGGTSQTILVVDAEKKCVRVKIPKGMAIIVR